MATTTVLCLVMLLLILSASQRSTAAPTSFLSPVLSPVVGDICKQVVCGKGSCRASNNSTLLYKCECDQGWKQTSDDAHLGFLPCVVPNCTLDYSCSKAPSPSPAQNKSDQTNLPFYNPCRWVNCGGGSCNKTSASSYGCICEEGYKNLFNVTTFPCYKQCEIGLDCVSLGISSSNASSPASTSTSGGKKTNQGSLIIQGRIRWLSIFMIWLTALCQ